MSLAPPSPLNQVFVCVFLCLCEYLELGIHKDFPGAYNLYYIYFHRMHFITSHGAVLVYDITDEDSFQKVSVMLFTGYCQKLKCTMVSFGSMYYGKSFRIGSFLFQSPLCSEAVCVPRETPPCSEDSIDLIHLRKTILLFRLGINFSHKESTLNKHRNEVNNT